MRDYFPYQLIPYVMPAYSSEQIDLDRELLSEGGQVASRFSIWANSHPQVVRKSAKLQEIVERIKVLENRPSVLQLWPLKRVADQVSGLVKKQEIFHSHPICEKFEKKEVALLLQELPLLELVDHLPLIQPYIDLSHRMMDKDLINLYKLIVRNLRDKGLNIEARNDDDLDDQVWQSLTPQQLMNIFSLEDWYERTPLYNDKFFKLMVPLLDKLNNKQLVQIFCHLDRDGHSLLCTPSIFRKAIPLLHKLSPIAERQELENVLSIQGISFDNKKGWTPLHYPENFKLARRKQLLGKLEIPQLVTLFCQKTGFGTPLHFPNNFEYALYFLKKFSHAQLTEVLSIKNDQGNTPLHDPDILFLALPLLVKLTTEELNQLLSITNRKGKTPLETKDAQGNAAFHDPEILEASIPLLHKLDETLLANAMSIKNAQGLTPIQIFEDFTNKNSTVPYFESLRFKSLKTFLDHWASHDTSGIPFELEFPEFLQALESELIAMQQHQKACPLTP